MNVCFSLLARAVHAKTARPDAPRTTQEQSPDRRLRSPLDTAPRLRKTARHAEHPWNQNLKVEALLLQARAVMRPRPVRAKPTA